MGGSFWLGPHRVFVRNFESAVVIRDPQGVLKELKETYPSARFRLWHLKAKLVEEEGEVDAND